MQGKKRSSEVYESVRGEILDGLKPPRARLRIDLLSDTFGASLGAVREALVRLSAEGLVVSEPPKGFIVASISISDLDDLTETRLELECRCLRLSIERGDLAWEGRVVGALHQLLRTPLHPSPEGSYVDWAQAHRSFHDALVSACESRWRLKLREQLFTQAERYRRFALPHQRSLRDVDEEHRAIAEAALARKADLAADLAAGHLRRTAELLRGSNAPFDDGQPRADPPPRVEAAAMAVAS